MKVLVGLSGGVDSAVAAYLLKQNGHEVVGATMSIWDDSFPVPVKAHKDACLSPHEKEDAAAAEEICRLLGIEHKVVDCRAEYRKFVLSRMKTEILHGRTPNPCVWCNAAIKFSVLPAAARREIDFDKFATGHYARVLPVKEGGFGLFRAKDEKKDQSYFLYRLGREKLSEVLFPLGELEKSAVRRIAREAGLPVSDKPDSQDFYAGKISDLLQIPEKEGKIVSRDGRVIGRHDGAWNYTLGQRKGLGIAAEKPLYVVGTNAEKNEVVAGSAADLTAKTAILGNVCLLAERIGGEVFVKMRSSQTPFAAKAEPAGEKLKLFFETPVRIPAAGQSVVLYDGDRVLGGGTLETKTD